jgi:membrane-bound lytic murein transglycosylase B
MRSLVMSEHRARVAAWTRHRWLAPVLLSCSLGVTAAEPFDYERDFSQFVAAVAKRHGLDEAGLRSVLEQAQFSQRVLDAMSRPAERKPWYQYRKIFLTEPRIAGGARFWREHEADLVRAESTYGVPPEIVVAIIGVETLYGTRKGSISVLDSLATLGFRYPRRADFFRRELEQFLVLSREERLDPLAIEGSYAGAMGIPQFISSSYRHYAIDFDGDGTRNLIDNPVDALGSVASYLARHGWERGRPIAVRVRAGGPGVERFVETGLKPRVPLSDMIAAGVDLDGADIADHRAALHEFSLGDGNVEHWAGLQNFYAITRYNRSKLYAMAVYQLAREIRGRYEGAGG